MPFTPSPPLTINYKQFTTTKPSQLVTNSVPIGTSFIRVKGMPSWLRMLNASVTGTDGRFYLEVTGAADTLTAGSHSATLFFEAVSQSPGNEFVDRLPPAYKVTINVQKSVRLALSPSVLTFSYNTAEAVPAQKTVNIVSESSWVVTKSESWVTVSAINGSQNAAIKIGVDPVTLASGNYMATVTVKDGSFTEKITVSLTVSGAVTTQEYLYVNPQNLEFLSQVSVANVTEKRLIIDTGSPWDAVASEAWLNLGAISGPSGINEIALSVNSAALAIGIHQSTVTVTANGIVKKAYVLLRVIEFSLQGLQNGGLYYAGDRNQIIASNIKDNSFLLLQIEASSENETKNFPLAQPYFKGVAKATVGLEANYLIPSVEPPETLVSGITNNVRPITLDIDAFEEDRFTGVTTNFGTYSNLNFLKGTTPKIAGRASYVPYQIFVSAKAFVQITTVAFEAPDDIQITGAVTATINGGLPNGLYLYTATIALSDYVLSNGDELDIVFGNQAMKVVINDDYTELCTIAFENEWGDYELFETRGFLTDTPKVDQTISTKSVAGKKVSRVIEADRDGEYELHTGFIYSQGELDWLSTLLNSKRFFLYVKGERIEVILLTKTFDVYKTREHIKAYRLKFKRAIV